MTRIAFFHTLPEERPFAEQWAVRHDVEVTFFDQELHDDTLPLLKGFNGLSYKQRTKPNADDPFGFFRRLHDLGIQQIAVRSAGLDSIDLPAAHAAGLRVTNVPSYSPPAVAELVLAQTMHLLRHIPQFDERSANGDFVVSGLMSRELSEITIGIIGVGRIGSTVARIFHALGAHVLGNDIRDRSQLSDIDEFVTDLDLSSWEAVDRPANATPVNEYSGEYGGASVSATIYDDPEYITVSVAGQEVTLRVSDAASEYLRLLR